MRSCITIAGVGLLVSLAACTTMDTANKAADTAAPAAKQSVAARDTSASETATDWRYTYLIFMVGETRSNRNRFVAVARNGDRVPLEPDIFRVSTDNPGGISYVFGSNTRFREVCIGTRHCAVFSRFHVPGIRDALRGVFPAGFEND